MWSRRSPSGGRATATTNSTSAIPVLNQLAPVMYEKIEDQKLGSSDRIQSIEAKPTENASSTNARPLSQDSPRGIGVASPRGAHKAKAASRFHSTTSIA